ncbi:hypothetical protein [Sphingomonas aerolata]|uniref:hypothetical protein n=1 Tax=Sphingomonas aerolata TaxID=185951 RepID=UPI002FE23A32
MRLRDPQADDPAISSTSIVSPTASAVTGSLAVSRPARSVAVRATSRIIGTA